MTGNAVRLPAVSADTASSFTNQLLLVLSAVIGGVIRRSEEAVMQITERVQAISTLSENQRKALSGALESYYEASGADALKDTLNDQATRILEAAQAGDLDEVERLSSNKSYVEARHASKKLHDTLQSMTSGNGSLDETIMPVLVALQFQDSIRQELESILQGVEDFFRLVESQSAGADSTPISSRVDFWKQLAKHFKNIETRKLIHRTALGDDAQVEESDVRNGQLGGDGYFF